MCDDPAATDPHSSYEINVCKGMKERKNHIRSAEGMDTSKRRKIHFQHVTMLTVSCNASHGETMKNWIEVFQIM